MSRFAFNKPPGEEGAAWPAILVGMFVAFGGILFGYDTGTISGITAMKYWLGLFADESNDYKLTSAQNSLIVSILSAGTFFWSSICRSACGYPGSSNGPYG